MRYTVTAISGVCYLADLKPKHLLKVCRLADEKQIESPASAEISDDDGIHWHGRKEGLPGCVEFLEQKNALLIWLYFYKSLNLSLHSQS